ncbi:MAG: poly(3-hydroxybutyrate) depolymerase [Myxococcota bacterium]|jgi:poly(3-hydroxybutyrate) depolymerase
MMRISPLDTVSRPSRRGLLAGLLAISGCGLFSGPDRRGGDKASPDGSTLTEHSLDGRRYLLYHPRPADPAPMPLILALHGRGADGRYLAQRMELARFGPEFPFVVLIPDGTCSPASDGRSCAWNSGNSIAGLEGGADDVAHLDRLLDAVAAQAAIDTERVFGFGFSNGAKMAYRLAAERSARLRGIGVIGGSIGGRATSDHPEHRNDPAAFRASPVSVFHLHGLDDTVVPPFPDDDAGNGKGHTELGLRQSIGAWIRHNRTRPALPDRLPPDTLWTSTGGRRGTVVQVRLISGRDHDWTRDDLEAVLAFFGECGRRR